jgi:cell division protein FtsX
MKDDDKNVGGGACAIQIVHNRECANSKNPFLSEEGVAYWFLGFVVLLIGAGLLIVVTTPIMNGVSDQMDIMVGDGLISEQTINAYTWSLGLYAAIPLILLIGLFIGAIIKGLEVRR